MKHTLVFLTLLCQMVQAFAVDISPKPTRQLIVLNGFAQAVKEADGIVYIGGPFSRVGAWAGSSVLVNSTTGDVATPGFPTVNGVIGGVVEDGAGGFFICGNFTEVDGLTRSNLIRITSANTLDTSWIPNTTNAVRGMTIYNDRIYYFSNAETENNVTVTKIRALQLTDGSPVNFTITIKGTINRIIATDNRIYVAGEFTQQTTSQAWNLAAYDLNGQLLPWNPNVNNEVTYMAITGDRIYYAGYFNAVGGSLRDRLAASSTTTGQLLDWNPSPGASVTAMTIHEDVLYLGGGFAQMAGQPRAAFAAFNALTGELLPFQAAAAVVSATSITVGPDYIAIGGSIGFNVKDPLMFLVIDRATGAVRPSPLKPNMAVNAVLARGENIFVGGAFCMLKGEERIGAAAFRADTGELTDWNPRVETNVLALAVASDRVFIAGELNSVGGQPRKHIAAVDRVTGALIESWNATPNLGIIDMALHNDRLFVGGVFTNISGVIRTNLAALDVQTGAVLPFNGQIGPRSRVGAVKVSGDTLYVGGLFSRSGTETRTRLAAFDLSTDTLTAWNPTFTGSANIEDIEVSGSTVYVVGRFSNVSGLPRTNAAAISITGEVLPWAPNPNGNTVDVAVRDDKVFLAGEFTYIGGQPRTALAATDLDGNVLPWAPNPEFLGYALEVANNQLYFGGAFITLNREVRFGFAGFGLADLPVEPPIIDLTSLKFTPASGIFEFNIRSEGSILVTPQYSVDLQSWNDLPSITVSGTGAFQDPNASSRNFTFYRLRFEP